jgi:hypothetical protein
MSVKATAQDRVKYLLTIKRNERSPSSEIPAHHHRNAQERLVWNGVGVKRSVLDALFLHMQMAGCCGSDVPHARFRAE